MAEKPRSRGASVWGAWQITSLTWLPANEVGISRNLGGARQSRSRSGRTAKEGSMGLLISPMEGAWSIYPYALTEPSICKVSIMLVTP